MVPMDLADDVMNHFRRGLELSNGGTVVKVEQCYAATPARERDAPVWAIPVSIEWWAYVQYQ